MTERDINKLRGGTLSLAMDYMHEVQKYALSEKNAVPGRERGVLTDTELEVIAQMWSEHCRHSLFNASIPDSERGIFHEYIKEPTLRILEQRPKYRGRPDLGLSIYEDNSGVFKFNDRIAVGIKNETHNSPSALDPYGGAITGIVGVNRDPMGTGLGSQCIANFLFYYFGHPEDKRRHFKRKITAEDGSERFALEELLLNPKQIYDGVNHGVQDGANQMGIALNQAMCVYHDRYSGKPIVGVGTIGMMPLEVNGKPSWEKHIDVGDHLLIAGGKAGRDGIHGATFSSEGLHSGSPMGAVQVGDAYTQKKLFEALLEMRDLGYIKFITDLGAGGVSCAALEMAAETGGLEANLDDLLIKYPGMTATEILMNESQERMAVAFNPEYLEQIREVFAKHEVDFCVIGKFTDSGRAIMEYKGDEVVNLDMKFIHEGYPKRALHPTEYRLSGQEIDALENKLSKAIEGEISQYLEGAKDESEGFRRYVRDQFWNMLRRPNLGSVAPFTDKMDSTVQGLGIQHCIHGRGRVSTKTSCITPEIASREGLIQSYGHTERQTYIDAESMGKNAFLRSIGNNVAMGGRLDYMVATDQALWQSADDGKYQQMLIEGFRGMSRVIEGCKIPVISGKDSMYNQATNYDENGNEVKRGVFPTILMTTAAKIDDVNNIVTIDAKQEGDLVYVVGSVTNADMGGSEFVNMYGERMGIEFHVGEISDEDISEVYDTFERMNIANKDRLLQSAKYVEAGGLVNAVKDTAMAGELGIEFDISDIDSENSYMLLHEKMYSETEGRFVVTIKKENQKQFEKLFEGKFSQIGTVKGNEFRMYNEGMELLSESIDDMLAAYHKTEERRLAA
jgi:phosphoribosylformylglycinamidine synthase